MPISIYITRSRGVCVYSAGVCLHFSDKARFCRRMWSTYICYEKISRIKCSFDSGHWIIKRRPCSLSNFVIDGNRMNWPDCYRRLMRSMYLCDPYAHNVISCFPVPSCAEMLQQLQLMYRGCTALQSLMSIGGDGGAIARLPLSISITESSQFIEMYGRQVISRRR